MSEQPGLVTGYTLSYKGEDGVWYDIPLLYQAMYDAYRTYCTLNNLPYVSKDVYFYDLVRIVELADTISEAGIVAIEGGGTGATTIEEARANLNVYSKEEVQTQINNAVFGGDVPEGDATEDSMYARLGKAEQEIASLKQQLADIFVKPEATLNKLGISWGNFEPDANTPGFVYFRY
jgi:hypothetical protein